MLRIASPDNRKIKRLKGLDRKKVRDAENLFFIEGRTMADQAMESGFRIREIYISDDFLAGNGAYVESMEGKGYSLNLMNDTLFGSISGTVTPQGILVEVEPNDWDQSTLMDKEGPFILLDGLSDPGNVGTIVRTCEAFGFQGVFALEGCADIYNPKTIRATMGSVFRVPYIRSGISIMKDLSEKGFIITGTVIDGMPMNAMDFAGEKTVLVIGNEANGMSMDTRALCHRLVTIPMAGKGGSLNAATAAGIVMHQVHLVKTRGK
ncbi:MAG: RNA methyltransferase [Clostridia bacterium]